VADVNRPPRDVYLPGPPGIGTYPDYSQEEISSHDLGRELQVRRGVRGLNDLIDALEAGRSPSNALYNLALRKTAKVKKKSQSFEDVMALQRALKERAKRAATYGQAKASAARGREQRAEARAWRNIPGIARGPLTNRGDVAGAAVFLIDTFQRESIRRLLEHQQRQRILGVGRRGAAATRPFIPNAAGSTNRTGAASTRPLQPSRNPRAAPSGTSPKGGASGTLPGAVRTGAVTPSQSDTRARTIMGSSPAMPKTQAPTRTGASTWQSILQNQLTQQLSRVLLQPLVGSTMRQGLRTRGSVLPSLPVSSMAPSKSPNPNSGELTPLSKGLLQSSGEQAPSDPKCKCPKPKKEKKKSFDCSNPLVSRSVTKDGIITIKRLLKCQPFKQKSPSAPTAPTTTSSAEVRSSTPAGGNSSRSG